MLRYNLIERFRAQLRASQEAKEQRERQKLEDARERRRENRETETVEINRDLRNAAKSSASAAYVSALIALLAVGVTVYQTWQSRSDAKTARTDALAAAAQARLDSQHQFDEQLHAQRQLRDEAARSATAASAAAFSAKAQTKIMVKQMALAEQIERPWIGIDGDIVPRWQAPVKSPQEVYPSLSIAAPVQLRNFGQRLAHRVQAQFKLDDSVISLIAREAHWREAAKPLCDEAEKRSLDENQTAVVIFPGSPAPAPFEAGFQLGAFSYQHSVLALGCIVYREQGAETIHHTRTLYRAEFGQQKQDISFPVGFYQEIARFTPLDVDAD